jgi:serine phosphatase RsbU (regulator of sigma subunit)
LARFRDLSIRSKLMTGFMLTSLVALVTTLAALAFYDRSAFRSKMVADLNVLAGVISENATSSIVFHDKTTARSTLAALRSQPHVLSADLFDDQNVLFASWAAGPSGNRTAAPSGDGVTMSEFLITVTHPVTFNNKRVGTLVIRSDTRELAERSRRYLTIAALVLAGAGAIALILSSFFQRAISRPILRLLEAEKRVSRERNFSLRVAKEADDEVGHLIDGFNEMLHEISARDAEIRERHRQEMALARSIQTSVLPRSFPLPGFDISAVMLPAEEVGGDFYEFRPAADGGAWLGIGDVTGHGVTSGLIMMMAQSMFTAVHEQRTDLAPSRFISILNRAMVYNLHARLGQDKFMTMVVGRLYADGRVTYAGAHTDILVYRAATSTIERLTTEGLWLGIRDDIEFATADHTLTLGRGDSLLLYTDGVVESRNAAGECYDLDRLREQFLSLHTKPASEIVTEIADTAWKWAGTPNDDISLMVLKRS